MATATINTLAGYHLPANMNDWTALLVGTAFTPPSSCWRMQDASGALADSIGSVSLAATNTSAYRQALASWSPSVIVPAGTCSFGGSVGADVSTTSQLALMIFQLGAVPPGTRDLVEMGLTSDPNRVSVSSAGFIIANNKGNTATGAVAVSTTAPTVIVMKIDWSIGQMVAYNNGSETIKPTWQNPLSSTLFYLASGGGNNWPSAALLYAALWTGVAAERSDADVAALISLIKTGRAS